MAILDSNTIPTSQMRKQRRREAGLLVPGHIVWKCWSLEAEPGSLARELMHRRTN